jgi:hypothetical protein
LVEDAVIVSLQADSDAFFHFLFFLPTSRTSIKLPVRFLNQQQLTYTGRGKPRPICFQ